MPIEMISVVYCGVWYVCMCVWCVHVCAYVPTFIVRHPSCLSLPLFTIDSKSLLDFILNKIKF